GLSSPLFLRLENVGRRLRTAPAPWGMVSLAMSLSSDESERILESWEPEGREAARRHLLLDYWFIPLYSTTLTVLGLLAARWFGDRGGNAMRDIALLLTWGAWLAGLLDFAENTTLLRIVHAYPSVPEPLTRLAGWFTRFKFLLIFLTLGTCAFALVSLVS
ncbi:MAG TPA: hypothetical protein VIY86_04075, partial [Pirellulaceae bacterium]